MSQLVRFVRNSPLGGAIGAVLALVLVLLSSLVLVSVWSSPPSRAVAQDIAYPGGTFVDDNDSVHEASIEALAVEGITNGCKPDERLYCPRDPVTREQMATFLVRALELPDAAGGDVFVDVSGVHASNINALYAAAITRGCHKGVEYFCPRDPVTREQMATFLVRALELPEAAAGGVFRDVSGVHTSNINALYAAGITKGCHKGAEYFCPRDPVTREQMATFLGRSLDLAPIEPLPVPWRLELVVDGIVGGTTDLQAPRGDARLFLVLKDGLIRIISEEILLPEPFLDIQGLVRKDASERGMLGMAFHPDYSSNRQFYVFYTDLDGHSQVYEYRVQSGNPNRADLNSARKIITFEQRPTSPTHKGGQLQFGPDGYLYIAVGDGGGAYDPFDHGQNPQTELGTIVRIDVDRGNPYAIPPGNPFANSGDGLDEVWAYGLRNPWRFSFDDGRIYIADVGQQMLEEVNVADADEAGLNYGWNVLEGSQCVDPGNCPRHGLFVPQLEYPRSDGISVIGGYVYRGSAIPEMVGRYFYTDFTGDWIRTFVYDGEVSEHYDWSRAVKRPRYVWSFGVDGFGELYLLSRWEVWKVVPNSD